MDLRITAKSFSVLCTNLTPLPGSLMELGWREGRQTLIVDRIQLFLVLALA